MQCNCLKYNYLIFRTPLKGLKDKIIRNRAKQGLAEGLRYPEAVGYIH